MKRFLALALLAALPHASALAVLDAGPQVLGGPEGAAAERRLLLDVWDAGDPQRSFHLEAAADSDAVAVEARARPARGPEGAWQPLGAFLLIGGHDPLASDRGWDGAYELALRFPLARPHTRVALLLLEEPPGADGLAITTTLHALPAPTPGIDDSRTAGPGAVLPRATPDRVSLAPALPPISLIAAAALLAALWARRRSPQR